MQMVKNTVLGLVLTWFLILAFMPKQELYYKLEEVLAEQNIVLNEKSIQTGLFSLTVHDLDVYVEGIQLATIKEIDFFTLLFYTTTSLDTLEIDKSLKEMTPTHISSTNLTHVIWNPMAVNIDVAGDFGGAEGEIDLSERTLHVDFNETAGIETLKKNLEKDEKGWYYETSF